MVRSWQWWAESRSSEGLVGNERASFLLAGSFLAGAPVVRKVWLRQHEPIKSTGLSGCCRERSGKWTGMNAFVIYLSKVQA